MPSKILVLGSKGFIGRALCDKLEEHGIPHNKVACSSQWLRLDQSAQWLEGELHGVDTVYIAAGRTGGVGRMARDPLSFVLPNVRIQMNVMEACIKAGVRRVISGQSITGYSDTVLPVEEDEYFNGNLHPAYFVPGNTWRFIGRFADMVQRASHLEVVFLRPSNVYGPRNDFDPQTSHVIEATVRKVYERQDPFVVWGNGEEKRDPTYIEDLAEALVQARDWPAGAYNIGTGQSVSVKEMVHVLLSHAKHAPEVKYDSTKPTAIPTRYLNCDKARGMGWKPKVSIEEGLIRTFDWYEKYCDNVVV